MLDHGATPSIWETPWALLAIEPALLLDSEVPCLLVTFGAGGGFGLITPLDPWGDIQREMRELREQWADRYGDQPTLDRRRRLDAILS